MTRTDVMASSRPQTVNAAPISRRSSSILSALGVAALLALALLVPSTALAAEPTAGYNQEPNKPKTTTTPSTGTSPSKESSSPAPSSEPAPASTSSTPKASTLPFTGFDLRWDLGFGLLLMGAGIAILAMLRRQRRHGGG